MNRHLLLILVFVLFGLPSFAEDEIPLNCENTRAEFYRPQLFPRYEDSTRRFLLVDWNTGLESITLATDINEPIVQGWSVNCRYITAAITTEAGYDTVVWDTVDNIRMGSIPDAIGRPHPTTWGPGEYLVVETRNGAILWNVPANTQLTLTTSFDPYTVRNFSRLRWDAINHQLIANFAVGGRTVYDLNTGQEVPLATYTTDSVPSSGENNVVIGGKAYDCYVSYRSSYQNEMYQVQRYSHIPYTHLIYTDQIIYLALQSPGGRLQNNEAIQMLEDNLDLDYFRSRGWSGNCHYVAASISPADEYGRDTVVWDIRTRQRMGAFPDAHIIDHPISWGTDALIIESRNGGYLWYLPTNTQTLITEASEIAQEGWQRAISNFRVIEWHENTVAFVTVDEPQTVQVYDAVTATKINEYQFDSPVQSLKISQDYLVVWDGSSEFINRHTGERIMLSESWILTSENFIISPDGRYLLSFRNGTAIVIWDLTQPQAEASTYRVYVSGTSELRFTDNNILVSDSDGWQIDLTTGTVDTHPIVSEPMVGTSGYERIWTSHCTQTIEYDEENRQLIARDIQTEQLSNIIANDINSIQPHITPQCDYAYGIVPMVNTSDAPFDNHPIDDIEADQLSEVFTMWNINTGEVVLELQHAYRRDTDYYIDWNPDGNTAYIRTTEGVYLFTPATRELLLLEDRTSIYAFLHYLYDTPYYVYWDYERGQIFVGNVSYDLRTGRVRQLYTMCDDTVSIRGYGTHIIDHTLFLTNGYGVGVWNLDTFENHCVPINTNTGYLNLTAVSPDERYLVIARLYIRVWDLQNLPEDFMDRQPIRYHGPNARITAVRFISNTIIETESADGIQYWDIETGEQVAPPA